MVKMPKDGVLGTDEGRLAYFQGLEEEGKSGKDNERLSKLCCMHVCKLHVLYSTYCTSTTLCICRS